MQLEFFEVKFCLIFIELPNEIKLYHFIHVCILNGGEHRAKCRTKLSKVLNFSWHRCRLTCWKVRAPSFVLLCFIIIMIIRGGEA